MIGKVDLVMWAKNGERFLPKVLRRIEEAIPYGEVNKKIFVDDSSVDYTVEIAKSFNWEVCQNPFGGIPSGANEALKHVESEFFVSVEQDVVLARDWWEKISKYTEDKEVAVAQGIRISTNKTLRKIEEYTYFRNNYPYCSIDNNILRTKIVERLGGFPSNCKVCMDANLKEIITKQTPYKWITDKSVISEHLNDSAEQYLHHCYKVSSLCTCNRASLWKMFRLFLTSPIRASIVALRKHELKILVVYPLIRYYKFKGKIKSVRAKYGVVLVEKR